MKAAAGPIRILSIVLTGIVAISFLLFVWDELGSASKGQTAIAATGTAQVAATRDVHGRMVANENSTFRIKLDNANDAITSPGESIGRKVGNGNVWAMRGLAFLFGMAIFLIGLRLLASWLDMNSSSTTPQNTATRNQQGGFTASSR